MGLTILFPITRIARRLQGFVVSHMHQRWIIILTAKLERYFLAEGVPDWGGPTPRVTLMASQ